MSTVNEILTDKEIILKHISKFNLGSYFVYLAGSLIEGFGNESSDIDVYIIHDSANLKLNDSVVNSIVLETDDHYINNIIHNNKRYDFEFWDLNNVENLINKVNTIDVNAEQFTVRLNKNEIDFLHRFKVSKCIFNEELYNKYRNRINFSKPQFMQVVEFSEQYDSYIEDLQGCMQSNDLETGYLLSHLILETSLTSFLCSFNETNPSRKWLFRKLNNFIDNSGEYSIKEHYMKFLSYAFNPDTFEDYLDKVIAYTNKLNTETQKYIQKLQETEKGDI